MILLFKKQYRHPVATMIKEVDEVLIDAAANDKNATAAIVADYDSRVSRFANNLEVIRGERHVSLWIAAFNLTFTLAVTWKIFT